MNAMNRRTSTYVRTAASEPEGASGEPYRSLGKGGRRNMCESVDVLGAIQVMKKLPRRSPLEVTPPQRVPAGVPPKRGRVPSRPAVDPIRKAPGMRSTPAPRQRPVAKIPSPRRPKVVRSTGGGLGDLFAFFPDLPRPHRPRTRTVKRRPAR